MNEPERKRWDARRIRIGERIQNCFNERLSESNLNCAVILNSYNLSLPSFSRSTTMEFFKYIREGRVDLFLPRYFEKADVAGYEPKKIVLEKLASILNIMKFEEMDNLILDIKAQYHPDFIYPPNTQNR